ncbi:hypothetical protein TNCV_2556731 [Trichonephila clavipes]|nr:hypothetical protein TNCV_2556731 [Trichonephila clavipes]
MSRLKHPPIGVICSDETPASTKDPPCREADSFLKSSKAHSPLIEEMWMLVWRAEYQLSSIRGLLVMNLVILKHGQVTRTTPEMSSSSPNYHTNGKTFELLTDLRCIAPLHGGSLVVLDSNSYRASHDPIS